MVWAMLSTAGTSRASAVVAAARQAAPLSLSTAMHNIGLQAGCSADSGNFQPGVLGFGPVGPLAPRASGRTLVRLLRRLRDFPPRCPARPDPVPAAIVDALWHTRSGPRALATCQ